MYADIVKKSGRGIVAYPHGDYSISVRWNIADQQFEAIACGGSMSMGVLSHQQDTPPFDSTTGDAETVGTWLEDRFGRDLVFQPIAEAEA